MPWGRHILPSPIQIKYRAKLKLGFISQAFASGPEFIATYGSLNNEQFMPHVYQNALARQPDAAGLAFWTN